MKKTIGALGALALGMGMALAAPTAAGAADAATIYVPQDFNPALSDTRTTGDYEVVGTGLRVWTQGTASSDKVAEYIDTETPLSAVGEPTLEYDNTSGGGVPGFQLVVDFDNDGEADGILIGEPGVYGNDWWLNNAADADVKANAPVTGGGSGSLWHGTLDQWRTNFPGATVTAFGFSLGSGVKGDGVIDAINFADTRYTFADGPRPVVLTSKDQCKNGGWATSTEPVYKNQGECVSSFAATKDKLSNFKR